jgi:hypothetical protein
MEPRRTTGLLKVFSIQLKRTRLTRLKKREVTDNLLEDWIQLPDTKPIEINVARMIKHVFTGNLNAVIDSNPPFPGKERHYLRA